MPWLSQLAEIDMRIALAVFVAAIDVWSVGLLLRSDGSRRQKALWSAILILCPIVGCVLWFVLGPMPRLVPDEAAGRRS